ncbi:hypothetical protein ACJMK2_031487, partial [Sinanodonta woodiana]
MLQVFESIPSRWHRLQLQFLFSDVTLNTNGYKINNFGDWMLERLFTFYEEEELTDFKIKVDERIFKVHKLVMACSSDYFRAMLSHDVKETRHDLAEMKGLTARGTEPLIKYAYSGKLSLTQDNVVDVVTGAMFLLMNAALDLCIKYMLETLNFENSETYLNIGEMYDISCIKEHYNRYLLDNFLNFAETRTFLNLDAETLAVYLSDDTLQTTSEAALLHHVLRWYNYDQTNREHCVYDVLDKVKMTIDGWPTVHFARKTEPFISNPQCRELVQFAVNFMQNADCRYLIDSHRTRVRFTRKTLVQFGGVAQYNSELDQVRTPLLTEQDCFGWSENHFFHLDRKCWVRLVCNADTWIRSHSAMIQFNSDFALLIGGYVYEVNSNTGGLIHTVKDVKIFSTQGNPCIWDIKPLQHERARHTAVYLSGCIYVVGGKDNQQSLSSVEMLQCDKVQWTYVRQLPNTLYDHAATVCNNKMYIAGGVFRMDVVTTLWCYTSDDKWKKKKSLIS